MMESTETTRTGWTDMWNTDLSTTSVLEHNGMLSGDNISVIDEPETLLTRNLFFSCRIVFKFRAVHGGMTVVSKTESQKNTTGTMTKPVSGILPW